MDPLVDSKFAVELHEHVTDKTPMFPYPGTLKFDTRRNQRVAEAFYVDMYQHQLMLTRLAPLALLDTWSKTRLLTRSCHIKADENRQTIRHKNLLDNVECNSTVMKFVNTAWAVTSLCSLLLCCCFASFSLIPNRRCHREH